MTVVDDVTEFVNQERFRIRPARTIRVDENWASGPCGRRHTLVVYIRPDNNFGASRPNYDGNATLVDIPGGCRESSRLIQ